jgi:hypothetical protein
MNTADIFALYGANEGGQITGTVTYLERMPNSRNGNPRFVITLENGTGTHSFFTKPNAMCAYKVSSGLVGRSIDARLLMYRGKVQIGSYHDVAA